MNKIILFLMVLLISGCEDSPKPELIETVDAGLVSDGDIVPTSFNESIKSIIKTNKGIFMVRGMPSVLIGESASIQKYDNGRDYLCIDSWKHCRLLSN